MVRSSVGPLLEARQLQVLRWLSAAMSVAFAAVLAYTIAIDGSPFRSGILTPWLTTTIVDYYWTSAVVYLWIYLRESSLLRALLWMTACFCGGSVVVWLYVWLALRRVTPGTPLAALLLGDSFTPPPA